LPEGWIDLADGWNTDFGLGQDSGGSSETVWRERVWNAYAVEGTPIMGGSGELAREKDSNLPATLF